MDAWKEYSRAVELLRELRCQVVKLIASSGPIDLDCPARWDAIRAEMILAIAAPPECQIEDLDRLARRIITETRRCLAWIEELIERGATEATPNLN